MISALREEESLQIAGIGGRRKGISRMWTWQCYCQLAILGFVYNLNYLFVRAQLQQV